MVEEESNRKARLSQRHKWFISRGLVPKNWKGNGLKTISYFLVLDDHHNHSDWPVCLVSDSQVHKINSSVSKSESAQLQPNRGNTWNRWTTNSSTLWTNSKYPEEHFQHVYKGWKAQNQHTTIVELVLSKRRYMSERIKMQRELD
jgi:hypothetical protein